MSRPRVNTRRAYRDFEPCGRRYAALGGPHEPRTFWFEIGPCGIRTRDHRIKNQVLFHLS
jgi:hypothetical protein